MLNWSRIRNVWARGSKKAETVDQHAALNATDATAPSRGDTILFFEEIASIATGTGRVVPAPPWAGRTTYLHLWNAIGSPDKQIPDAERWWNEATGRLLRRFPAADRYALDWLCDIPGRHAQVVRLRSLRTNAYGDATPDWLKLWVLRRPVPERAERIEAALLETLPPAVQGLAPWYTQSDGWAEKHAIDDLIRFLPRCATTGATTFSSGPAALSDAL
jgi:hypothetical protein